MSSQIASPLSIRWGRMRCFTTTRSKPGASMRQGGFAMFLHRNVIAGAIVAGCLVSPALAYDFGRRATPGEVKLWDLGVGQGTLSPDKPIKTVGSFWPYATTLFDYIHRAMPYQAPASLSVDDTYAVAAYILNLNGILPADGKLDKETLPKIKMPNRDGFIPEHEFRKITNSK